MDRLCLRSCCDRVDFACSKEVFNLIERCDLVFHHLLIGVLGNESLFYPTVQRLIRNGYASAPSSRLFRLVTVN